MTKNEKVMLSFLLVGPPVGLLAFLLSLVLSEALWTCVQTLWCLDYSKYHFPHPPNGGRDLGLFISGGFVLSYFVGGIPAVLVGLFSSFWYSKNGRLPLLVSVSVGLLCAFSVAVYDFNTLYQNYNNEEVLSQLSYHGPIGAISENEWRSYFGWIVGFILACSAGSWAGWKVAIIKIGAEAKS
jgi:hypothetical protein